MTHPSQSAESAQGLSEPANITAIRKRYAAFEELNTSDALNHVYASTWTTIRDLLAEIDRLRAKIAESEPELPGDPDAETIERMEQAGPIMNARAAVRTTKKSIAARIRALRAGKE